MIAKKNSKFDFDRRRIMLLQAGLLTAGSFTLAAFTYRTSVNDPNEFRAMGQHEYTYELLEVDQPKEELPKVEPKVDEVETKVDADRDLSEELKEAKNTAKEVKSSAGVDLKSKENIGIGTFKIGTTKVDPEKEFDIVDINAAYIGGPVAMVQFIEKTQVYPEESILFNEQGTVYVRFIVEKDGRVTHVKTEKSVSKALDREAERIVRAFPKWKPGEIDYQPVRTVVRLPIKFVLE